MTPVDLQTMGLLYQAGWDLDRIFRLCVQSVNGIPNAEEAAGPTPHKAPSYATFQRIAQTLKRLDEDGYLSIGRSGNGENETNVQVQIAISPQVRQDADVMELFRALRLDPNAPNYLLTNAVSGGGGQTLAIVTRPLTGTMFYLANRADALQNQPRQKN